MKIVTKRLVKKKAIKKITKIKKNVDNELKPIDAQKVYKKLLFNDGK